LLYAVRYAYDDVIVYLVQKKAKLDVLSHVYTNAYSETYMGSKYNHFELIRKLGFSPYLNARDTINHAICENNYKALDKLLELSVDLNNNTKTKNNYYGNTPLIVAVYHIDKTMINYMIDHGADPNLPNLMGKTPYTIALNQNKQEILTLLKQK
jgi:ankyrin repeat protein